jgi:hypothetical protein
MDRLVPHSVYIAAAFGRREEMRHYSEELALAGHNCTSTWVFDDDSDDPRVLMENALRDLHDVCDADTIVLFTETPKAGYMTGGRHTEFGYAYANGKRCCLIGPRENIFHHLPGVEQFDTWAKFLEAL